MDSVFPQIELSQLENIALFKDLSNAEIQKIIDLSTAEKFVPNHTIIEEGSIASEVYLLLEGEVIISKWDEEHSSQVILNKLPKGEMFGEMSFIDNSPRSTTVKATRPALLLKLSRDSLSAYPEILAKIISNLAVIDIVRIRYSNNQLVKQIKENQYSSQFIQVAGELLFYQYLVFSFVVLLSLYFFRENGLYISWLIALPLVISIAKYNHYEWAHFGMNFHKWPSTLFLAVISTGLVVGIMFLLLKQTSLGDLFPNWDLLNNIVSPLFWGLFAIYAFVQEFIARGIFQTSLKDFLRDDKGYKSIFLNAAFLFVLLFPFGFEKAMAIFLISLPLGYIFFRQKSLLANFLIHFFLLGLGIFKY